ncbi:MAG TPA: hypothetical protein VF981_14595 [Gemmatimonadaceae bacterium]
MALSVRATVRVLGLVASLAFGAQALLSYALAGAAGFEDRPEGAIRFHAALGERVATALTSVTPDPVLLALHPALVGPLAPGATPDSDSARVLAVQRAMTSLFSGARVTRQGFAFWYSAPLVAVTIVALLALLLVRRQGSDLAPETPRQIFRWAGVFGVVMAFALPVLVPDFWMSIAWGRAMRLGANPYYLVPPDAVQGLPFDPDMLRMTYGPLWGIVSWGVAIVSRGAVFWAAVLFKLLLIGAWLLLLRLVWRSVEGRSVADQCTALLAVGWLPLGPVHVAGDGHNDVLMVAFVVLWMLLLGSGRLVLASVVLALSVGVKYATAPLFMLDALWSLTPDLRPRLWSGIRAYATRAIAAALVLAVVFAPFIRSLEFFAETAAVREGRFFLPADAVKAIGTLVGVDFTVPAYLVMGVFPIATLWLCLRYWRRPDQAELRAATAGIMLSMVWVAAGHVWPWYVMWLLPLAVLLPDRHMLSRFTVGVALAAPFWLVPWIAWPRTSTFVRFELPSLMAYVVALAWMLWVWRFFGARGAETGPAA